VSFTSREDAAVVLAESDILEAMPVEADLSIMDDTSGQRVPVCPNGS
jgi:hypothetical protein